MSANVAKIAKATRFFMLAKNTHDKYLKYRKNTKCNKIPDLKRKEAKKGPEMSANMAKIAKVTGFLCQLKTPMTNISNIAKIPNVTKFQT